MENTGFSEITNERLFYTGENIWYLEVALTGKCNFNCVYCNRFKSELDVGSFYNLLDSHYSQIKHIQITGGEPTTHPKFMEIMHRCRDNAIHVGLSTNGSGNLLDYLNCEADMFSISLDDYDLSILEKRGYKKPQLVIDNIKALCAAKRYVNIGLVIDDLNYTRAEEIIKYILSLGVNDIKIATSTKSEYLPVIDGNYEKYPILNYRVNRFKNGLDNRGNQSCDLVPECGIVKNDVTIVGNSHYPCLVYFREGGRPIGKINNSSYKNILNERALWAEHHDCSEDEICKKYCMDFKCEFNKALSNIEDVEISVNGFKYNSKLEEIIEPSSKYGYDAVVTFKKGAYGCKYNEQLVVKLYNLSEIHNRYSTYDNKGKIAFESDIHATGQWKYLADLKSVVISDATEFNEKSSDESVIIKEDNV